MQDESSGGGQAEGAGNGEATRPQQAGEAGTTRFGMEDGDNTDVPSTGGPQADEEDGPDPGR
jgi:hypothetical protein